jgi:hypothetical protein
LTLPRFLATPTADTRASTNATAQSSEFGIIREWNMNNNLRQSCFGNRFDNWLFLACILTALFASGCGGGSQTSDPSPESDANIANSATTTTTVEPSGTIQDKSPATADSELPSTNALPDEICLRFMNLLKSGNRLTAERLLTRRAETVTNRGGFPIQPLGSPVATYRIGETRYATNKQELAHVDCQIADELNGKPIESSITWMVRKQQEGWRICGIIFESSDDQPADFLSFENPDDVAQLKGLIEEQTADASDDITK